MITKQERLEQLAKIIASAQSKPYSHEIEEPLINNGSNVVLPCKIGDDFWYISKKLKVAYKCKAEGFFIFENGEIYIIDQCYMANSIEYIRFTEEDAKKALEELYK